MTMRILLANANTSDVVTEALAAAARRAASHGTEIVAVSAVYGVPVIQTAADLAVAHSALLETVQSHVQGCDGLLVGVSLDLALEDLRKQWALPVEGMTGAALAKAGQQGARVGVITFGETMTALFRLRFAQVDPTLIEALDMSPAMALAGRDNPDFLVSQLNAATRRLAERGAQVVLPIGATVAGLASQVKADVPVLDCMTCAVEAIEESVRTRRRKAV